MSSMGPPGGTTKGVLLVPCLGRHLSSLLLVIAILSAWARGVEPASSTICGSNSDCPVGSCCSGNPQFLGYCKPAPFAGGKQVCQDCGSFPAQQLACPASASTCCSDGTCQKSVAGCKCSSYSDCPVKSCCKGDANSPGVCSPSVFVGSKQVCPNCVQLAYLSGLSCPSNRAVCCSDGSCQPSAAKCTCASNYDCPAKFCCTGNSSTRGVCSPAPFVGGKQVCQDCGSFPSQQLACPGTASVCCLDGTCQKSVAGCKCTSSYGCPIGSCCTSANPNKPGRCSPNVFVGAKQLCPDCSTFASQQLACPASASMCCYDGTCQKSGAGCSCSEYYYCPAGFCCKGNSTNPALCSSTVFAGGSQVCKDCSTLANNQLACPATASVCCRDGSCQKSLAGCKCSTSYDCPSGACCTGNSTRPGVCSPSVFVGGKQVCSRCEQLSNQGMTCPADHSVCCSDGTCQKSGAGCSCGASYECPQGFCCTGTSTKVGLCSSAPLVKGKQVCPDCSTYAGQQLACPASASTCCSDGTCQKSVAGCGCSMDYDCPRGTCCTGNQQAGTKGHCSPSPFVNGKQVCPDCRTFAGQQVACPASTSTCCLDGSCQTSVAGCKCSADSECPQLSCCTGNSTAPGVCSASVIVGGKQVCGDCRYLSNQQMACPAAASVCCITDGTCQKTPRGCACTYNGLCPRGSCCTGNSSVAGVCNPGVLVGGKQVCQDCSSFASQRLACPESASVCCSDGTCQRSISRCSCLNYYDCPQGYCCTGDGTKRGLCSPKVFEGTRQVCKNCASLASQRMSCPTSFSVCCNDGSCQRSVAGCACSYHNECPTRSCCQGNYTSPGKCSAAVFSGKKQVCLGCAELATQQMACPSSARVCCASGLCKTSEVACQCTANSECPQRFCCTGDGNKPGVCAPAPFVNGKQVCMNCRTLGAQQLACPREASVCCYDGTCRTSVAKCACSYNSDCPSGSCCTGNYTNPGVCSSSPFVGGKQVCQSCSSFISQQLACPASASVCCSDGTCQSDASKCSCSYGSDCPPNFCCTGDTYKGGHCTPAPFAGGKQVCKDCTGFPAQQLACPASASLCCIDGTCQASAGRCSCGATYDCPAYFCCKGNSTVRGLCSNGVFVNGRQVCKDCRTLADRQLACPRNLPYCCADGKCAANANKCSCTYDPSCPGGICCADRAPPPPYAPPPPPFGPHTTGLVPPAAFKELKFYNPNFRYASYRYVGSATRLNWDLVASVDWRVPNKVTGVKNQGTCGACWAFATVGAIEAANAIATGGLLSLSEQQVLDCQGKDKCMGGWPSDALEYVANVTRPSGGLTLESNYKYSQSSHTCNLVKANQGRAGVAMWEEVNFIGWFGLLLAVQNQPLVVSVAASSPSFINYVKGVYDDPECFAEGLVDHTLLLVGYVLFADTPYWILKNSWGPRWGERGFMRLAMRGGEGACGINTLPAFYPVMPSPKSPCKPNPCGGGTCQVAKGGLTNQCKCPPFFIPHANIDKSQSCAPSKVCRFFLFNPCGIGTCVDDRRGSYSCICRRGFVTGFRTNGNPTCVPSTLTTGASKYVVQEGDTCYLIYVAFSLTLSQFLAQNPRLDCLTLQPPKVVIVTPPRNAPNCVLSYAINDGDTCAKIEAIFGIKSVLAINFGLDCTKLVAGLQICVATSVKPVAPAIPTCGVFYTVQPGDTCQSIWTAKKLTQRAFFTLNPGLYCGNLQQFVESRSLPGEQVCVAAASATGTFVCPARSKRYKVRRGDTCQSIIYHQCKRNFRKFRALNRNLQCQTGRLYVNQFVCVPV